MSVTIEESPNPVSLSGDYLFYRVSSTNVSQLGFRLRVTVDVNGTERYSGYHFPNAQDQVIFDVSAVIEDLVETSPIQSGKGLFRDYSDSTARKVITADTNAATVIVGVQEYYSDSLQGAESTDTIHVFKGYGYQKEGLRPDRDDLMQDWLTERTADGDFITMPMLRDVRLPIPVAATQDILNTDGAAFGISATVDVRTYNGTTQTSDEPFTLTSTLQGGSHTVTGATGAGFLSYIVVERDLLVDQDATLTLSEWNEATYVEVAKTSNADNSDLTPKLKLEFKDAPCKHKEALILWWNRYGGFDWMLVDARVEKSETVDRKTRRTAVGDFNTALTSVNQHAGSIVSYGNTSTTTAVCRTVDATVEELELARSCQRSRQVMLWYDGEWRPVIVDSVDFPYSKDESSLNRPITFNLTMADEQRC
ncbi:MAG: hypothetical protein CBD18_02370 [Opitutales bacterium TMED158]|mgnify:CR=1 FL=1|nr:MAG: hypothetical protein CBD18_02370 [Opitutales bacterium TMED158]|tara:strand:- start:6045 stop:7310 length:1266 start_codon:yes stop_codon:yes gene_type:complete